MAAVDIRHCGCEEGPPGINARHIVVVFYCGECGGFVSAKADTVDNHIAQLTELRETHSFVFASNGADGVQFERRPAV